MLYLEDLTLGMTMSAGPITITEEHAIEFAKQYDPQFFHTDPEAAKNSFFKGLAVSGWHVAALTMKMLVESDQTNIANGLIGIEMRRLHWPRPTRAGDTLSVSVEVLETKTSRSQPGWGTATLLWRVFNQNDELAMETENVCWVACKPG